MQSKTTTRANQGEVIVPFVPDRAHAPMATHIRSTMLTSSVASLRARGLFDAYRANLDPADRDELPATVAGFWLPIAKGIAHYEACDRLRLPAGDLVEIGANVGARSTQSALSLATRLAAGSGVTPWTILTQSQRLWDRAFKGAGLGVFKLGPKEARVELVAWPLARIEYNRVSFRGILRAIFQPFCTQMYVNEVTSLCTPLTVGYRVAWA
ncbi:MAG: hypothetical protein ACLQVI_15865 [Polyangiaceae bacterium]|jgi:hypothetical protein